MANTPIKAPKLSKEQKANLHDAIFGKSNLPMERKAALYDASYGPTKSGYSEFPPSIGSYRNISPKTETATPEGFSDLKRNGLSQKIAESVGANGLQFDPSRFINKDPNIPLEPSQQAAVDASIQNDPQTAIPASQTAANTGTVQAPVQNKSGLLGKVNQGLGTLVNYGVPAFQTALGWQQLQKAGARPVDQLNPDYLASIEAARQNLSLAKANSKFGFSPEENTLLNQDNANLTNAERFSARNYSGGSGTNAYNMEQSAINNSFGRGLQQKVANRELMNQKQAMAMNQQSYLDNMIATKAEMSRRLFNDKMNAYGQQQQIGGNLLGAGLSNAVGASRYSAEQSALDAINKKYNPNG